MSAALHLAGAGDIDRVLSMVAAFHAETGIDSDAEARRAGVEPLLTGSPYGAVYIIGPVRAPIGYLAVTFGWSLEFGGMDGFVDELWLRPAVRGRGIALEVLTGLPRALAEAGVRALHLEVDRDNASARRLYARAGFVERDRYVLMTKTLT